LILVKENSSLHRSYFGSIADNDNDFLIDYGRLIRSKLIARRIRKLFLRVPLIRWLNRPLH